MKTKEQIFNTAEFELGDFANETGIPKNDLLVFFYSMSRAFNYDSTILVEYLDDRERGADGLSRDIKVREGY